MKNECPKRDFDVEKFEPKKRGTRGNFASGGRAKVASRAKKGGLSQENSRLV